MKLMKWPQRDTATASKLHNFPSVNIKANDTVQEHDTLGIAVVSDMPMVGAREVCNPGAPDDGVVRCHWQAKTTGAQAQGKEK